MTEKQLTTCQIAYGLARIISDEAVKEFRMHPMKSSLEITGALAVVVCALIGTINIRRERIEYENIYIRVKTSADINKDGSITEDEWKRAYRDMGLFYDARKPVELTRKNLETYIAEHKKNN